MLGVCIKTLLQLTTLKQLLADRRIPVLEHSSYSPNLASRNFYLFPKVKTAMKRTRFCTMEEVKIKPWTNSKDSKAER